jgi:RHS repeat-associated protein
MQSPLRMVPSIALHEGTPGPDGSGSVTGRVSTITLPTGGVISYTYSGGCGYGLNADATTGAMSRTTSDSPNPTTYTRSPINPNATTTTVTDPSGNQSVYAFTINASDKRFYETRRFIYNGSASGSGLTLGRFTCYNGAVPNCDGALVSTPITSVDTVESFNGGKQTEVHSLYSSNGNLNEVDEFDFDRQTLLRKTMYQYNSDATIANQLGSVTTYDGNAHVIGQSAFVYDRGTLTPTSGLPQHVAPLGTRNNVTAVTQMIDGSSVLLSTYFYDDAGSVIRSTSPSGTTQLGYESTDSYVQSVTPPTPITGASLTTTYGYDQTTGLMTSRTDPNGASVNLTSADALLRPLTVTYPTGGGVDSSSYSPVDTDTLHTLGGNEGSARTVARVDGYGRLSRAAVFNGQGANPWYESDTCYDANGRIGFVSSRYQGIGFAVAPVCSGAGDAYAYDAMGRPTLVTHGDGTTVRYTYKDRAVQVVNESGNTRIIQTDALGRTTAVCEISSGVGMAGANTPVACGTDVPGTGFLTTYAYDLVNHKTTVAQGAQTRIFQTDALGRTVMVQEPEAQGPTTYSYAYTGGGELTVTRQRPQANQTNPSVLTSKVSTYDTLGRLRFVHYTDGGLTPDAEYLYDNANWAEGPQQTNLKGRLSLANTGNAGTLFSYDAMGHVINMWEAQPSGYGNQTRDRQLSFGYDLAGNVTNVSDPSAGSINYGRSVAGEISSITNLTYNNATNPGNLVSSVQNGPFGPTGYVLGNGLGVNITYDSSGRVQAKFLCHNQLTAYYCNLPDGSQQVWGMSSNWSGTKLVGSIDTAAGIGANYSYDEFDRLKSMTNSSNNQTLYNYTYDRYGNRWAQNPQQGGQLQSATFDAPSNRIVTSGYAYDAAGNLIQDGVHSYTYDAEGNVLSVDGGGTASYIYDALNQRVQVKTPGSTLEYTYDFAGRRITTWDANANFGVQGQIWWGSQPIAFRSIDNSVYFQQQDWLGTERVRTNYAGSTVNLFTSLPFGDALGQNGTSGTDQNNFHFAQLEHDSGNTDHAQFRQYSNLEGRWMSMDHYLGSYDFSNPQSLNRYSYTMNNPMGAIDPSGLMLVLSINSGPGGRPILTVAPNPNENFFGGWNEFGIFDDPQFTTGTMKTSEGTLQNFEIPIYNPFQDLFFDFGLGIRGTPNNNPCAPSGTAPAPTVYQERGQRVNSMTNSYDPYGMSSAAGVLYNGSELYQFKRGGPLDAQVQYGGSTAYANYVFGVYLSAAGWTLPQTLAAANDYAAARSSYPTHPPMDPNYPATPAANVANITAGYNAQQNGTLCHN